ncbi:MAG: ArdC-like ssDNA-binding domain-containing protein [bacterium]|nr:ArdC-like ssDNA-binding domain-containing protein [bacterium]
MTDREKRAEYEKKAIADRISILDNEDNYKAYLAKMALFHYYSCRNIILIDWQNPNASWLESFSFWKKNGRIVKKGEKSIRIIAPIVSSKKTEEPDELIPYAYTNISLFDFSQTEPSRWRTSSAFQANPDTVLNYETIAGRLGAICGNSSAFSSKISEDKKIKMIVYKTVYSMLGCMAPDKKNLEMEALSALYVVCSALKLGISDINLHGMKNWAEGKSVKERAKSLERIRKAAHAIIEQVKNS